ncbi:MAG: energy transducer TonB [Myxococcota bacterium]|nr:energy transducer TonB [Myxococcota bacterium]
MRERRFVSLAVGVGLAAAWVAACAAPVAPTGTLDELSVLLEQVKQAEQVEQVVAISGEILRRQLEEHAVTPDAATGEAVARAWFDLAEAQVAAYDRSSARPSYLEAIAAIDEGIVPSEPVDSRAYTQLALLDRTHPDALAHASRGVGILERRYDARHIEIVEARIAVADVLWVLQAIVDAHSELLRALKDARALVGEDHVATAEAYYRLAAGNDALRREKEAEVLYLAAIGVLERLEERGTPGDSERRSEVHAVVADFYRRQRRRDDAAAQSALAAEYSAWTHKQVRTKNVSPVYPPGAKEKKIEGWVEVVFTVSSRGTTEDVHVVEASPDGIFERAAIWAVEHWRYKPGLRDGHATEQRGVRARLRFTRDD